jgi:hypothetical protein
LALLAVAGAIPARAEGIAGVLACRNISDDRARLACFDRESATLATGASQASASAEQRFGLAPIPALAAVNASEENRGRATPEVLNAKLAGIGVGDNSRLIFTLDNGQVWRQIAPGADLLLKVGDPVRISHGALGSFVLTAPSTRSCKVTRVR